MSTLLLRFAGPLQAWGSSARFNVRMTEREPTKSGVIGFVAAAIGRKRKDSIEDLLGLKYGVRIDQAGVLLRDFHTAKTVDGSQAFVSNRYYLADAVFLVGLEGNDEMLEKLDGAIKNPVFPLFLGRRSCPPAGPVSLGIRRGKSLQEVLTDLETAPWQASEWYRKKQGKTVRLELALDAEPGDKGAFLKGDEPISFDQRYRRYGYRSVVSKHDAVVVENLSGHDFHDAMREL